MTTQPRSTGRPTRRITVCPEWLTIRGTEPAVSVAYPTAMATTTPANSPRRDELLEKAYRYVLEHGVGDLSLRPLAAAVHSSPRVLLFLFGSKAELIQALLGRAREDELELLAKLQAGSEAGNLVRVASKLWSWLAADEHRALL